MRKLILCEGKHDGIFFKKLFPKIHISISDVRVYDQETRAKLKDLRNAETKELNKFSGVYCSYKILVKSEAGKNKASTIFSRIMNYCITRSEIEKTILMLDLDGITLRKQLDNLEQKINTSRAGESIFIESNTIKKTNSNSIYLTENKVKIKETGKHIGRPFYLILFTSSLETELNNIDPSNDTPIEDKISGLVGKKDIQDMFSLVLG